MTERDYEQEARAEGWKPKEEWGGPEDKWVEAETFVERGEKISGILKSKVDRLAGEVERLKVSNQKFGEYHKQTIESQRKEAETKIQRLEHLLSEAVTNGDGQTFTNITREINTLKTNMPNEVEPGQYSMDPIEAQWLTDNPWYNSDPVLRAQADGVADAVANEGYGGRARLDEISRRVKETFPDKFENPNRGKETVGEGAPTDEASSKRPTYKNLPPDAKAACKDFVDGGFMSQDEYVKQYYELEGE
jgi:hypothetical protein